MRLALNLVLVAGIVAAVAGGVVLLVRNSDDGGVQITLTIRVVGCRPPWGCGHPGNVTSMASSARSAFASASRLSRS